MADDTEILSVATTTHGRVLVRRAASPRGILAGFHGYLESADVQLARLESMDVPDWTLVSIQALHRVYRGRTQDIAASWMTRQDRETTIDDNVAYVAAVLRQMQHGALPLVHVGFSQGGQMAFRAAVRGRDPAAGVVSVGADVPPELLADSRARFPAVLLMRGTGDTWYTQAKHEADIGALRARGVNVDPLVFAGAHEWNAAVAAAVATWLEALVRRRGSP